VGTGKPIFGYPWVTEEDAKRIAELAAIRSQQTIYEEAERLKPR
jgi:hypothetical protein